MDNNMLGKIGRGFCNDGIFGVVRAAFGIDKPSAASAAVADDRDCRRLVIDDSGARGLKIDEYWLYPFRQAQSFTMARERPTLSDLASDLIALEFVDGDYSDLRDLVDMIVRKLGVESPDKVLVDMRMTVEKDGEEPEMGFLLSAEGTEILRTAATFAMGCEMVGRPLLLNAYELDFMPRNERVTALYRFSLALPTGAGQLIVRGSGFVGLCIVWRVLSQYDHCRAESPLKGYSMGDLRTFRHFSPFAPVLASFSPLGLFVSRSREQEALLRELVSKLDELLFEYLEGNGGAVWERWRMKALEPRDYFVIDTNAPPAPLEPWRNILAGARTRLRKGKGLPTLEEITEAVMTASGISDEEQKEWVKVALNILRYLHADKEGADYGMKELESVSVMLA